MRERARFLLLLKQNLIYYPREREGEAIASHFTGAFPLFSLTRS